MGVRAKRLIAVFSILAYAVLLPLCLYLFSIPSAAKSPDLKKFSHATDEYVVAADSSPSLYGFDATPFEAGGFALNQSTAYVFGNEPNRLYRLELVFTDEETYYITMKIYAEGVKPNGVAKYKRCEIGGKAVGIFEPQSDDFANRSARYFDTATKRTYYIEPFSEFTEAEYRFLEILVTV